MRGRAAALRRLGPANVPAMANLIHSESIGWQQTENDLALCLATSTAPRVPTSALGVFDGGDGAATAGLSAMAMLNHVSDDWSWLAYVATDQSARQQGHARRLVEKLLADADDAAAATGGAGGPLDVGLFASAMGAPLYESLGFADSGAVAHIVELGSSAMADAALLSRVDELGGASLVAAAEAKAELRALDAAVHGPMHGRRRVECLDAWCGGRGGGGRGDGEVEGCASDLVLVDPAGTSGLAGYVLTRPCWPSGGVWIGPLVATGVEAAEVLLRAALAAAARAGSSCAHALVLDAPPPPAGTAGGVAGDYSSTCSSRQHPGAAAVRGLALAERVGFGRLGETRLMLRRRRGEGGGDAGDRLPWLRRGADVGASGGAPGLRPFLASGFEFGA